MSESACSFKMQSHLDTFVAAAQQKRTLRAGYCSGPAVHPMRRIASVIRARITPISPDNTGISIYLSGPVQIRFDPEQMYSASTCKLLTDIEDLLTLRLGAFFAPQKTGLSGGSVPPLHGVTAPRPFNPLRTSTHPCRVNMFILATDYTDCAKWRADYAGHAKPNQRNLHRHLSRQSADPLSTHSCKH
jgi:hypothetical protein